MSKKKNKKNDKPKSKNTYSTQINNTNKNKDNMNEKDNRKKIIIEKENTTKDNYKNIDYSSVSVTKNEKYVTNLQESIIAKMEDVVLQADLQGVEYYDLKESIGISIGEIKDLIHKSVNLIEIRNLIFHKEGL